MKKNVLRNERGFTLIEIIAVLIILGILAAVAIPKYMGVQEEARNKMALAQISEVKGRLSQAMARYMLEHNGGQPEDGDALITAANGYVADSCPTGAAIEEGDFKFKCDSSTDDGDAAVEITVSEVQDVALNPAVTGKYNMGYAAPEV